MPPSKVHPVHPGNASYESLILGQSPLGFLRCNEVEGTTLKDLGSAGVNGTVVGSCTLGSPGPVPMDSGGYVSVPTEKTPATDYITQDGILSDVSAGTILSGSFWVYKHTANTNAGAQLLFAHRDSVNDLIQVTVDQNSEVAVRLQVRSSATALGQYTATVTSLLNRWAHFAFSVNRSSNTQSLWVDGVLVASGTTNFSGTIASSRQTWGAYYSVYFNGGYSGEAPYRFANCALFTTALTTEGAKAHYLVGKNGA